jgi:hypothetical protein
VYIIMSAQYTVAIEGLEQDSREVRQALATFGPCTVVFDEDTFYATYTKEEDAEKVSRGLGGKEIGSTTLRVRKPSRVERNILLQREEDDVTTQIEALMNQSGDSSIVRRLRAILGRQTDGASQGRDNGETNHHASASIASQQQVPKLPFFSGTSERKDDVPFDLWAYEVRALLREGAFPKEAIAQAVRRSLRGSACRILLHLGDGADAQSVLDRLETLYGTVVSDAALMQQFYTEVQREGETAAEWGCRLQDLVAQLHLKGKMEVADDMLRTRFWTGLRSERIRNATRHRFDAPGTFLELHGHVRVAEHELTESRRTAGDQRAKARVNQQEASTGENVADVAAAAAVAAVKPLVDRLEALLGSQDAGTEGQGSNSAGQKQRRFRCYECGRLGHFAKDCRSKNQGNENQPLSGSRQ